LQDDDRRWGAHDGCRVDVSESTTLMQQADDDGRVEKAGH
jgi:hypothetical protein